MQFFDKATGNLSFSKNAVIYSSMPLSELLAFGLHTKIDDMGTGYEWVRFRNLEFCQRYFFISVCFRNKIAMVVNFVFFTEPQLNTGWDSWSEQHELKDLDRYKQWLYSELGDQRKFTWGNIEASYDAKGGSSSIFIKYI